MVQEGSSIFLRLPVEQSLSRPVCETTYSPQSNHSIYPGILCVSRKIREEASYCLYGRHSFHFGEDLEAIVPFLNDRTPDTRDLIRSVTLYKRGPIDPTRTDSHVWVAVCRALRDLSQLDKLTIVIEGGRPRQPWDGPRVLTVSDFRLLYSTRHESLEWVRELASVRTVNKVEIVADVRSLPVPKMNTTLLFAAFSAAIETTFIEFIKNDLGIPARLAQSHMGSAKHVFNS